MYWVRRRLEREDHMNPLSGFALSISYRAPMSGTDSAAQGGGDDGGGGFPAGSWKVVADILA
jgi:hypothetical protein